MSVLAVMIGTAQLSALRAPRPPSSRPRPRPRPWGRRLAAKEGISYQPRASGNRKEQQTEENDEDVVARLRSKYTPSLELGVEETIDRIMEALRNNNEPYYDFGIEMLYRFAGRHASPFGTSFFFGRPLDLGQFERFRRVMNTEKLRILIGHTEFEILSRLDLSETKTIVRTRVANSFTKRETVFQWTLEREIGGRVDGVWFCSSLLCDEDDDGRHIYGVV